MNNALEQFRSVPRTRDEVEHRIGQYGEIAPLLDPTPLASDSSRWMRVLRSRSDPRDLWAEESPFDRRPPLLYPIETDDPVRWLAEAKEIAPAALRSRMVVADHEPHAWFLLEEAGTYYLDARAGHSAVEWSVLLRLTPEEDREYHAVGRPYVAYLAARIASRPFDYTERNLTAELGERVTQAVAAWRASRA